MLNMHNRVTNLLPYEIIMLELRKAITIRMLRNILLPKLLLGVFPALQVLFPSSGKTLSSDCMTRIIFNMIARNHIQEHLLQFRITHLFNLLRRFA